jgi:hypothetical protein
VNLYKAKDLYLSILFIIDDRFIKYLKKEFNMTEHTSIFSKYQHTATSDSQDIRDKYYEPDIIALKSAIEYPTNFIILDQGQEGSCTGFGLAAVINLLKQRKGDDEQVSQRMFMKWLNILIAGQARNMKAPAVEEQY